MSDNVWEVGSALDQTCQGVSCILIFKNMMNSPTAHGGRLLLGIPAAGLLTGEFGP